VFGSAHRVMPRLKPAQWEQVVQLLTDVSEEEQGDALSEL